MDTKILELEKFWYNAVMVAVDGNPGAMRALRTKLTKQNTDTFPGWAAAFEYLASDGKIGRMETRTRATMPDPNEEWENLEQRGTHLIFHDDSEFPPLLREIEKAPLGLYVRGELGDITKNIKERTRSISIVGTRRATPEGKVTARRFARELARAGITIVSGLALGIDAEAHEGCLEAAGENNASTTGNASPTIAILACGVDKFYPRENERLAERILAAGGAIISEYPPNEPPYPDRFLERNRIVSGISEGTLIVECPQRSGSLATANFAVEQNRHVFVVPGPISHPNFFESHKLIRQGAELVTTPEEILSAYNIERETIRTRAAAAATNEEKLILSALNAARRALDIDKIIEITKLEPRVVTQALSFLVLREIIKETGTGYIIE